MKPRPFLIALRRCPPRLSRLDPLAQYPRAGMAGGLLLIGLLVPILRFWHGATGPLGQSIPLFFLVPVVLTSAVGGPGAGVLVSCAAIGVWDWFFINPLYTITIASARDVLALVVFLVIALMVGSLSTLARRGAEDALRRVRGTEALYTLSTALITHQNLDQILPDLTQRLRETFDLEACAVLLPTANGLDWRTVATVGRLPSNLHIEENRGLALVVERVQAEGKESVLGHVRRVPGQSDRMVRPRPGQERARLLPLRVGARAIGVLELVPRPNQRPDPEREHLLTTFANAAAIALEQGRLMQEEQAATLARESDRLKSALLSSVSHDLRTPLAGIKAAASSLLQEDVVWSEEDRHAFLTDIDHEADRLTRLVSNLLDLSRIEAGAIRPSLAWEDVDELIERVTRRLAPLLAPHPLARCVAPDLPPALLDAVQIEQVLTNLLENAAKYSPPSAPITVAARVIADPSGHEELEIAVTDEGMGIPAGEQERIFDTFYRVAEGTRGASGTGMGLAIVKGLVEAHGGRARVASAPDQGSTFSVLLPLAPRPRRAPPAPSQGERRPAETRR
ncbi:MAG TPA: ATP-binding protein [Chloroflexota bacterium]|nr:ATP-binding protein [Chloroflexota bacterium]